MPSEAEEVVRSNGQFACKFNCDRYGQEVCVQCNEPFCPDHASTIDPKFCCSCLSPQSIQVEEKPLVDDEGVTHNGVVKTPVGAGFKTLSQRIHEMTDEQLRMHIQHVRGQVKEAEAVLDYRRIDMASSEVELEQRQVLEQKRLRGVKIDQNKIKIIATGGVGSKGSDQKKQAGIEVLAKLMQSLGITPTPENVIKFAQGLAAKQTNGK